MDFFINRLKLQQNRKVKFIFNENGSYEIEIFVFYSWVHKIRYKKKQSEKRGTEG